MVVLVHKEILSLHQAAVASGLSGVRDTLLVGLDSAFVAGLPTTADPSSQLLSDLGVLSRARLADGSMPLEVWLENALALAGPRIEADVFRTIRSSIVAASRAVSAHEASLSSGFERFIAEKTEGFVGREQVFSAIEAFLSRHDRGYLVIEGDSGAGKSALLAEYVRRTACVAHFNGASLGTTRTSQFVDGVSEQLRRRFDVAAASSGSRGGAALAEILERSARRLPDGDRLVIAVDGLDEVERAERTPGTNVLDLPAVLQERVYFVLTRRPAGPRLVVQTPMQIVDLGKQGDANRRDARSLLDRAVQRKGIRAWIDANELSPDAVAGALALKCEENFMYLICALGDIEGGRWPSGDPANWPQGLTAYYRYCWERAGLGSPNPLQDALAILYVLAEAKRPLLSGVIARLSGVDEAAVQRLVEEWTWLIRREEGDPRPSYSIAHASFREFLYWQDVVQAAGVTVAGGRSTIAASVNVLLGDA